MNSLAVRKADSLKRVFYSTKFLAYVYLINEGAAEVEQRTTSGKASANLEK